MDDTPSEVLKGLSEVEFWSAAGRAARIISEEGYPPPLDWAEVERVFLRRFAAKLEAIELPSA